MKRSTKVACAVVGTICFVVGLWLSQERPLHAALPKQSTLIDIRNRDTVTVIARGATYGEAFTDAHAKISEIAQHFGIGLTRDLDSLESIREVPSARGVQLEVTFYSRASILTSQLAPRPVVAGERAVAR
jgi:hypothetical protein